MWHISCDNSINELELNKNKSNNTHQLNDLKSQVKFIGIKNLVEELTYLILFYIYIYTY